MYRKRIIKTIRYSIVIAFIIMSFGVLIFELIPDKLVSMFTPTEEIQKMGVVALRKIAPSFLGAAIAITLSSVFQAVGDAIYSLVVSFSRQIVIFLPAAYFLGKTGDVGNVWWCFLIAEFMSVGMSLFYTYRIYRKRISLLPLE